MTLRITYEGRPLVGYSITASINDIKIDGARGTTDRSGEVRFKTEPLPIPNIDVQGEKQCGGAKKSWDVSGWVYMSPTSGNFFHLKMEDVIAQMSEMSGMSMDMFFSSFGLGCDGSLGSASDVKTSTPTASSSSSSSSNSNTGTTTRTDPRTDTRTDTRTDPRGTTDPRGSADTRGTTDPRGSARDNPTFEYTTDEEWEAQKAKRAKEREESDREWEEKKARMEAERKQNMEDIQSGKMAAEGYQNQKQAHEDAIARINNKLAKKNSKLNSGGLNAMEKNDVMYDIRELELEKQIKENRLDKINASIAKGNTTLNKSERQPFKEKEDRLKNELDNLKMNRKNGVMLAESPEEEVPTVVEEAKPIVKEAPVVEEVAAVDEEEEEIAAGDGNALDPELMNKSLAYLKKRRSELKAGIKTKGLKLKMMNNAAKKADVENQISNQESELKRVEAAIVAKEGN